jgi:Uncharacterized conserved protein related to C-terminal domain of eukaryotic chaperone, SACSIN, COG2250
VRLQLVLRDLEDVYRHWHWVPHPTDSILSGIVRLIRLVRRISRVSGKRVERLKARARRLLDDAQSDFQEGFYDVACFHAEQPAQLFVKGIILELFGREYAGHGLRELVGYASRLLGDAGYTDLAERVSEYVRQSRSILIDLESAYIDARYGEVNYDAEVAGRLLDGARALMGLLEEVERIVKLG